LVHNASGDVLLQVSNSPIVAIWLLLVEGWTLEVAHHACMHYWAKLP